MDDVAPTPSLAGTRANSNSNGSSKRGSRKADKEEDGEEEDAVDEDTAEKTQEEVRVPTMYRWISTSRVPVVQGENGNGEGMGEVTEKQMRISFSVPVPVLPPLTTSAVPAEIVKSVPLARPKQCAAPGCGKPFKYRLVKDWTRGACGIECLKILYADT